MKRIYLLLFIVWFGAIYSSAQSIVGTWKGILITGGEELENAHIIYLEIENDNNAVKGLSRIEINGMLKEFAAKSLKGSLKDNYWILKEEILLGTSRSRYAPECKLIFKLQYIDTTGYLKGTFRSPYCRHNRGEVILFKADVKVSSEEQKFVSHNWKKQFVRNYKKGYPAPAILEEQRKNFVFHPIYFDFDKAEIRPKFYAYLNSIARMLYAFTDLRVKITGNTDSYGTDGYNMDLSKRRADAIRAYFQKQGINPGKLDIDFKGERNPASTNKTAKGRQQNRRVNFKFI